MKKQGLLKLLEDKDAREHFRASVESELGRPAKAMGEPETESPPKEAGYAIDEQSEKIGTYSDAYKRVGRLMSKNRGKLSRQKAIGDDGLVL